jgi:hypothetical protein
MSQLQKKSWCSSLVCDLRSTMLMPLNDQVSVGPLGWDVTKQAGDILQTLTRQFTASRRLMHMERRPYQTIKVARAKSGRPSIRLISMPTA